MNNLVETIGRFEGTLRAAIAVCTEHTGERKLGTMTAGRRAKERLHGVVSALEDEQKLRP